MGPESSRNPYISLVITSYDISRIRDIKILILSLRVQEAKNFELIFIVEQDPILAQAISEELVGCDFTTHVAFDSGHLGLARARNLGSSLARGQVIAFADDDVALDSGWSLTVETTFQSCPELAGITGPAYPTWDFRKPSWIPPSFEWLIGTTGWFASESAVEIRNCWGMNMAFRRDVFSNVGGFPTDSSDRSRYQKSAEFVGQRRGKSFGSFAEDVGISLKIFEQTGGVLYFIPSMIVFVDVHKYRLESGYIVARSRWIGHTQRSLRKLRLRTLPSQKRIRRQLSLNIALSFIRPFYPGGSDIDVIVKKYRLMLLVLASFLVGFLNGP